MFDPDDVSQETWAKTMEKFHALPDSKKAQVLRDALKEKSPEKRRGPRQRSGAQRWRRQLQRGKLAVIEGLLREWNRRLPRGPQPEEKVQSFLEEHNFPGPDFAGAVVFRFEPPLVLPGRGEFVIRFKKQAWPKLRADVAAAIVGHRSRRGPSLKLAAAMVVLESGWRDVQILAVDLEDVPIGEIEIPAAPSPSGSRSRGDLLRDAKRLLWALKKK